jgi:aspartate kinase
MLNRQIIPVVTGFIGSTQDGKTTTMGRGGSDYTAAVLSVCTRAEEVWVWSSVDGMMSADPLTIPEARIIDELSYDEVAELAYFGARILHARMIRPIQDNHIPLRIKNVYRPQQTGTLVHDIPPEQPERIKAVTSIPGIGLTGERSGSLVDIIQLVDKVLFETTGTRADVMISAQSSRRSFMCFVVPTSAGGMEAVNSVKTALQNRLADLADPADWTIQPVSVVTAIGRNLDQLLGLDAQILQQLEGIPSLALAEGPSRCSLSVVIHPDNADDALQRIHTLTLKHDDSAT